MRVFENSNFKIEYFDMEAMMWETNFIVIIRKNSTIPSIRIGEAVYNFYSNVIRVDVSDYIRAMITGEIQIYMPDDTLIHEIEFDGAIAGFSTFVREIMPPFRIPFIPTFQMTSVQFYFYLNLFLPDHVGKPIEKLVGLNWKNIGTVTGDIQGITVTNDTDLLRIKNVIVAGTNGKFDNTFDYTFGIALHNVDLSIYFRLETPECEEDYVMLEWSGEQGLGKTWFFRLFSTIRGYNNNVNIKLNENPDGYNVLKNKTIDFTIGQKKADLLTRKYLADIVFADDVYLTMNGKKYRVWIENKNIVVNETEKLDDINLSVKFKLYDTI